MIFTLRQVFFPYDNTVFSSVDEFQLSFNASGISHIHAEQGRMCIMLRGAIQERQQGVNGTRLIKPYCLNTLIRRMLR